MTSYVVRRLGFVLSALMLSLGVLGLIAGLVARPAEAQTSQPFVEVVSARGIINPSLAHYLARAIDQAEQDQAVALVVEMDTPGGLDTSLREIIQRVLASHVPVMVYVAPPGSRAASAGVYITYAAHVAAMAPNTNIGSATPVSMGEGGEQQMSPEMRAKVTNDAIAYIHSLAEERGRNGDWAEQAVRDGANVPASQALQLGVVDIVAADIDDLLRQADGRTVQTAAGAVVLHTAGLPTQRTEMGLVDGFLHAISDPTIAYILISLGTMGMFFELANPGSILPGVAGGICLLLGFYALGTLPVNYAGLLLMGFAALLFVVDTFAPTHGILSVGGLISFLLGSLLLFNVPGAEAWVSVSIWTIVLVTLSMGVFFLLIARLVTRSYKLQPVSGREGLIGRRGVARTALEPSGMVFVDGALWTATSTSGPIEKGAPVEVLGLDGLHLQVSRADAEPDVEITGRWSRPIQAGG
jgi:membrane-bound serine protease (ClpP class)